MKLNETQIKKIIKKVISEYHGVTYTQLRRNPVLNITDQEVLSFYFSHVTSYLEETYDVEVFDGTKIPDYIKPHMDEIVDGIDFDGLNDILWETITNHIMYSPKLDVMLDKLGNELKLRGKAWD